MSEPRTDPFKDMEEKGCRTPSYLLGRIEGAALALKAGPDVNFAQADENIIRDASLLAKSLEHYEASPPETASSNPSEEPVHTYLYLDED